MKVENRPKLVIYRFYIYFKRRSIFALIFPPYSSLVNTNMIITIFTVNIFTRIHNVPLNTGAIQFVPDFLKFHKVYVIFRG